MGQEAMTPEETAETSEKQEIVLEQEQEELEVGTETESQKPEAERTEQEPVVEDIEVVLNGEGSPPASKFSPKLKRRLGQMTKAKNLAKEGEAEARTNLEIANEKLKIQAIQIEQLKDKETPMLEPDPKDFEDGVYSPDYVKKIREYDRAVIKKELSGEIDKARQASVVTNTDREQAAKSADRIDSHYARAEKNAPKDFYDIEAKAIEILGEDVAMHIVNVSDSSEKIMCYMGNNPEAAQRMKDLFVSNAVRAVAEIGRLEANLVFRSKQKQTPAPDEEVKGSVSSQGKSKWLKGAKFS